MAKTYNFRITAEGLSKLKTDLADAGQTGKQAFASIEDAIPGVGNAARRAEAEIDRLRAMSLKTANDNTIWARSMREASTSMEGMGGMAGRLAGSLAALGPVGLAVGAALGVITVGLGAVSAAGQRVAAIEGPLRVAAGSATATQQAMTALAKSAFELGAPLSAGAEMFGRMARASGDLGATRTQIMQLTDTVQKLGMAGGASATEVANGTTQLGQALASGRLQGDELRSILESMPTLAKAIADGLGVSVGQLREMGTAGQLTSERVFGAILSQTDAANRAFAQLPDTVERASQRASDAWDLFLSRIDKAIGLNEKLAAVINQIARGINAITPDPAAPNVAALEAERNRLLNSRNQGGLLGEWFASKDAARLLEVERQLAQIESDRLALAAEGAGIRQQAFKREYEAMQLIARTGNEITGEYERQTAMLQKSEAVQKASAEAEKARLAVLKEAGVGGYGDFAKLSVSDPAKAAQLGAEMDRAADAAERFVRAQIGAEEAKKRATETAREQAKIEKESWDLVVKQAAEYDKARTDAEKRGRAIIEAEAKKNVEIEKGIVKLENEAALSAASTAERRAQSAILEAQSRLYDDHGNKIRDLTAAERARITAAVQLRETNEAQVRALEEQQRATDQMIDRVVDYGGDRFADFMGKNRRNWREMLDDMGSTAIAMFAKMAFEAAARPMVMHVVGAFSGLFGSDAGGSAAAPGRAAAAASGASGGSWSSILDFDRIFGAGSGSLSPRLDAWAARNIGWGGGASAATGPVNLWEMAEAGLPLPAAPGLLNGGSALGGFASASNVLGIVGAALPGLISGNLVQAGFGVGGAALGTVLFPGLGTAIGGVLGNLVGGLFGGDDKKPVGNAQFEGIRNNRLHIGAGGVTSLDDAPTDAVVQMRAQTETAVNKLIEAYGLVINKDLFQADYGDQRFAGFGNTSNIDLFTSPEDYIRALFAAGSDKYGAAISGGRGQVGTVLDLMRAGTYKPASVQEIDEALALGAGFDRNIALAGAGGTGTRQGQRLGLQYQAEDAARTQAEGYTAYLEKARKVFGAGSVQDQQATAAVRQQALAGLGIGPEGGGAALTGRGAEIASMMATIDAAAASLKAAGLTDPEITAAQAQARDQGLQPYRQSLTDQMALANAGGANTLAGQGVAMRMAAEERATGLKSGVTDLLGTAEALYGRDSQQFRDAQAAARNQALTAYGIGPGSGAANAALGVGGGQSEALTGLAAGIAAIKAEALAAKPVLEAAGLSVTEVAQAMAGIEANGVAQLRETFQKDIDRAYKGLTDPEGLKRDDLQDQVDQILDDARALGDPESWAKAKQYTDLIVKNFETTAALAAEEAANKQYAAQAGAQTATMVAQQQAAVTAAQKALTEADAAVAKAQSDLNAATAAVQQQITAAGQAAQNWASVAERLGAARRDLTMGDLSPYSEAEKLRLAAARVTELRGQIVPGGTDAKTIAAMEALPDAIRQYLQLDKLFNTASDDSTYGQHFRDMTELLDATETTAVRQARLAQNQYDLLQAQLPTMGTNVKSIAEATAAMNAALSAQQTAQTGVTGAQQGANNYLAGQFDVVAGKAAAYAAELRSNNPNWTEAQVRERVLAQHGGERDAILNAITDWKILDQIGNKYWEGLTFAEAPEAEYLRASIARLGGKATFALGGKVAGGIAGIDSVNALLMPGERVLTVQQDRIFEALHQRVVNDNLSPDIGPIIGELAGLPVSFRNAMVPTESLLSRILDENRRINVSLERIERRLAEVERPRDDMFGRNLQRKGKK